jgi:hypothetical protein
MTFPLIKPYGWQTNEKLLSTQLNTMQTNMSNALDKTGDNAGNGGGISGEIDVLAGGSIDFIGVAPGNVIGDFALLNMDGYSAITFASNSGALFESGSGLTLAYGSNTFMSGFFEVNKNGSNPGGELRFVTGSFLTLDQGSLANVNIGAQINLNSGSLLDGYATVNMQSGSITNLLGTVNTNSWAVWTTPQSRTITQATQIGQALSGSWTTLVQGISSNAVGNQWVCCLDRLHNGATLNQVVVTFQVWETHSGVPANLPSLSVLRYNNFNLDSAVALGIPDPQSFSPTPGSGSAWYDSQNTQFLVYDCVHNNVIDNSQYTYYVIITDESGTNSEPENNYGNITLSFNGIPNQSWQL